MRKKIALLLIDCQNDFCDPKGSLYVPGAVDDSIRLSKWILDNKNIIDHIVCTLDSHHLIDIAHPGYWRDSDGNMPAPFTNISVDDLKTGKWKPIKGKEAHALWYLESLSKQGQYSHQIWPEHCLIGTHGHNIQHDVNNSIQEWASHGRSIRYAVKGVHPDTESYGIFKAQVPIEGVEMTQYNYELEESLSKYDTVYVAGQAKNFCVANSIKQVLDSNPGFAKKIVIIDDCMSSVPGFDGIDDGIWDKAKSLGVRHLKTSESL